MLKTAQKDFFVTVGIQESDPGFSVIKATLRSFDQAIRIGACLWQIKTSQQTEEVFQTFNAGMLHRRIDSSAALLLLNPVSGEAKWHLRQPLSDLIASHWQYQNNLLISVTAGQENKKNQALYEKITQLGMWAPLGKTVWYVSSPNKTQDAFHYLLGALRNGDSLSILDGKGNVALWQQSAGPLSNTLKEDRAPQSSQRSLKTQKAII